MAYDRQLAIVLDYQLPPSHGDYVVTEFSVQRWGKDKIAVNRSYRDPKWQSRMAYHELFVVGPRGGVEEIYSNLY